MPVDAGVRERKRPRGGPSSLDSKHRLLANRRRRTILGILLEEDEGRIAFSDLATEIMAREDYSIDPDDTVDRDKVIIDLHHRQLPRLVDAGVVEYDHRSGLVRYREDDERAALLHEHLSQRLD